MNTIVDREREYHNARFADDSARHREADGYYKYIANGFALHRNRVFQVARDSRVLDYGCGVGHLSLELAACSKHVIGVDLSDVAIALAAKAARERGLANVEFRVENAEAIRLPDASFDVVCGSAIIHHLDTEKAVVEIRRLLRPGGVALFVEPLGMNPVVNAFRQRTPHLRSPDEHPLLERDFKIMRRYFGTVEVRYFGMITPGLAFVPGFKRSQRAPGVVVALDSMACSIPLLRNLAWYSFIEMRA